MNVNTPPRERICLVHAHSRRDSQHHGGEQSRIYRIGVVLAVAPARESGWCVHIHTGNIYIGLDTSGSISRQMQERKVDLPEQNTYAYISIY